MSKEEAPPEAATAKDATLPEGTGDIPGVPETPETPKLKEHDPMAAGLLILADVRNRLKGSGNTAAATAATPMPKENDATCPGSAGAPPELSSRSETDERGDDNATICKATAAPSARDLSQVRTYFKYDWVVGEAVTYQRPAKSTGGSPTPYEATIYKWPKTLPKSDKEARVWIRYTTQEGWDTPEHHESLVCLRSLEKRGDHKTTSEPSSLEREEVSIDSEEDDGNRKRSASTVAAKEGASSRKKARMETIEPPGHCNPVDIPPGRKLVKVFDKVSGTVRDLYMPTSLEIEDAVNKQALRTLLDAVRTGLDYPDAKKVTKQLEKVKQSRAAARKRATTAEAALQAANDALAEACRERDEARKRSDAHGAHGTAGSTDAEKDKTIAELKQQLSVAKAQVANYKTALAALTSATALATTQAMPGDDPSK